MTLSKAIEETASGYPDQLCLDIINCNYVRTYSEFVKDVDRCAMGLLALGITRNSKVAIWTTNIPQFFISFWACAKIGAIVISVNTALKKDEVSYIFQHAGVQSIIMIESCLDLNFKEIIEAIRPSLTQLEQVISVGFKHGDWIEFGELMDVWSRKSSPAELAEASSCVTGDSILNIQYTSGTTGHPKGVVLTNAAILENGRNTGERMGLSTEDRMMIPVPMFHCFGIVLSMVACVTHGTSMFPLPYFSARTALACVSDKRITCINGSPTIFIAMMDHEDFSKTDFSCMRTGIMAGAYCTPELMRTVARPDKMNIRGIVSVYGQTECAPGNTMSAWTDDPEVRYNSVGRPYDGVECKIVKPGTEDPLPDGQIGEFCARGYNTMLGYYKMPMATFDIIDSEGFLHSGDLAYRDSEGNYHITGRIKDIIIRGGENLFPTEIESVIAGHEAVKEAVVVGVPDRKYGEEAVACIILKRGFSLNADELKSYLSERIARFKVPKYVLFFDRFPMTSSGKVQRTKLREEALLALTRVTRVSANSYTSSTNLPSL